MDTEKSIPLSSPGFRTREFTPAIHGPIFLIIEEMNQIANITDAAESLRVTGLAQADCFL
jgi:hypothetical protein